VFVGVFLGELGAAWKDLAGNFPAKQPLEETKREKACRVMQGMGCPVSGVWLVSGGKTVFCVQCRKHNIKGLVFLRYLGAMPAGECSRGNVERTLKGNGFGF